VFQKDFPNPSIEKHKGWWIPVVAVHRVLLQDTPLHQCGGMKMFFRKCVDIFKAMGKSIFTAGPMAMVDLSRRQQSSDWNYA